MVRRARHAPTPSAAREVRTPRRDLPDPLAVPRLTLRGGSRVRRESEVRRAFDRGRSAASGDVVVYAYARGDELPPRYALVVGRKWGDAVTRNRVRRLLRESFRTARPQLAPGFDMLLLPRGRLHARKMEDVRAMLVRAATAAVRRHDAPRPVAPQPGDGPKPTGDDARTAPGADAAP